MGGCPSGSEKGSVTCLGGGRIESKIHTSTTDNDDIPHACIITTFVFVSLDGMEYVL